MKTYKNLYDELVSIENVKLAIKNCSKGKMKRRKFKQLKQMPENYIKPVIEYIKHFHNAPHTPKIIYDGIQRKKRSIIVPTMMEQIVHHALVNIVKPIISKPFYYHSYGSIPGKGAHSAKWYLTKYIQTVKPKYCLKMDIKKYFDNVDIEILKTKFKRIIKDDKFLNILFKVLDVLPKGIPLGFYTSQWIANFFLTDLDHFIKEKLKAKCYIRYMDDMVILDDDKELLHKMRKQIDNELHKIKLELKGNYAVFPINSRFIDFLGIKFYTNRTTLRKNLFYKCYAKALRIKKRGINIHSVRQMLSYKGWVEASDTKHFYKTKIEPLINFKTLQMYESHYDKRSNHGI